MSESCRCLECNTPTLSAILLAQGCCQSCTERRSRTANNTGSVEGEVHKSDGPSEAQGEQRGDDEELIPADPSAIARSVKRLKTATFGVIETRERLPQPFFWSLFYSQISDLRERKEKKRIERKLMLYPHEE